MSAGAAVTAAASRYVAWWRQYGAIGAVVGTFATLMLAALLVGWSIRLVGALVAVGAVMALARRHWPQVPVAAYFTATGKVALPLTAGVGGLAAQVVIASLFPAALPGAAGVVGIVAGGIVAASALSVCMAIFGGKIMKSIYDLVPAIQQPELRDFLAASDPAAGSAGQQADLSALEPATVRKAIGQRVIGQDAIVSEVVATTFRRAELRRPNKPLATFLMVGPTGVGKSELAKALATVLFAGRLINLPLNQLKKAEDLWSLIGPPAGYMGSDRGGKLCRDLGRLGTGVLVLDEIEKAHTDVIQALMRLLDEGQITEQSTGTVYSARGFLIVATSNAAAAEIGQIAEAESDADTRAAKVRRALCDAGFLPEVIARFDGIFPFRALSRAAVAQIVCTMAERHAAAAGVELVGVDGELLIDLIRAQEKGADAGMRGLDRAVERACLDGFLAVRKGGYRAATVKVVDGTVDVRPVADAIGGNGNQG